MNHPLDKTGKSSQADVSMSLIEAQELLEAMPAEMREMLSAALAGEIVGPLEALRQLVGEREVKFDPATAGEAQLLDFIDTAGLALQAELAMFCSLVNGDKYNSRILDYAIDRSKGKPRWQLTGTTAADPGHMDDGLEALRALMDGRRERNDDVVLSLWLHPLAHPRNDIFIAYVRRNSLPDALFILERRHRVRVPLDQAGIDGFLQMVVRPSKQDVRLWKSFLKHQAHWMREHLRDSVQEMLKGWGQRKPLSDERWDNMVSTFFLNEHTITLYQEAVRELGAGGVMEAHALLMGITHLVSDQIEKFKTRQKELEKDFEKRTRRMHSDLERQSTLTKGIQARANRVDAENRELLKKLQAKPASEQTGAGYASLGQALDALF